MANDMSAGHRFRPGRRYPVGAEAFAELAYFVGYQRARPDDGERWALQADALSGGDDGPLAERIASVRGVIAARRGDLRLAEAHFRRAEERVRGRLGPAHPLRARALGADTPDRAVALAGLAQVRVAEGACAEGAAEIERALSICERSACEPIDAATIEFLYATAWVCAGRPKAQVTSHARRALALFRTQGSAAREQIAEVEAWLR